MEKVVKIMRKAIDSEKYGKTDFFEFWVIPGKLNSNWFIREMPDFIF